MSSGNGVTPVVALRDSWVSVSAAVRVNAENYISDLCSALGVPAPQPAGSGYEFERPLKLDTRDGTAGAAGHATPARVHTARVPRPRPSAPLVPPLKAKLKQPASMTVGAWESVLVAGDRALFA